MTYGAMVVVVVLFWTLVPVHHNDDPKSIVWTAKAEDILEKVRRARATLDNLQSA
jgi:hypothetical protein